MAQEQESEYVAQFPEVLSLPNPSTGFYDQIKEPVYQCLSKVYFGDQIFDEGETMQTHLIPNAEMVPLNKAAARAMEAWMDSLPLKGDSISMEEFVEASHMLQKHPRIAEMNPKQINECCIALVREMKAKRGVALNNGRGNLMLPEIQAQRAQRSAAPPMSGVRFSDPSRRGLGVPAMGNAPSPVR